MSQEQSERHLQKVARTSLQSTERALVYYSKVDMDNQLPLSPEHFHQGLKVPLESIEGIWKKASKLLINPNCISAVPGYGPEHKIVKSRKENIHT